MCCDWGEGDDGEQVTLQDHKLNCVRNFRYLGSTLADDGELDKEVCARTQVGWSKWKEASGVLFDKGIPEMVKGKLYATMVRPTMMYGSECWAVKKEHVHRLVVESRMLRWMMGVKWQDKLENEYVRVRAPD